MRCTSVLLAVLLGFALGCDFVVGNGQTTVLGNRGSVFGSATPNAVNVRPGGTLVVEDADLFGQGKVVTTIPAGMFPAPGAAIESNGGTVRILNGRIAGGNVLVTVDPNSFPVPLPEGSSAAELAFAAAFGVPIENIGRLAPALSATDSSVEIVGGTLIGSSVFGAPNPYVPSRGAVSVIGGQLRIRGGEFLSGQMMPPFAFPFPGTSVSAWTASVQISGGNFDAAPVMLAGDQTRITGGRFGAGLSVISLVPLGPGPPLIIGLSLLPAPAPGCTEIRGGSFSRIDVSGPDPVFIFGSQFNVPLGQVMSAGSIGTIPPTASELVLSGVFPDGTPFQFELSAPQLTNVMLVQPGDPGCAGTL